MLRILCVTFLTLGLFAADSSVLADSSPGTYRDAVQRAYDLIRDAKPPATEPATRAAGMLGAATGHDQPEIQADLAARPPDYEDARARLQALMAALDEPGSTADPALAKQRLHEVMAQSRYDALHRPPSPLEQLVQWVRDRLLELYRSCSDQAAGHPSRSRFSTSSSRPSCSSQRCSSSGPHAVVSSRRFGRARQSARGPPRITLPRRIGSRRKVIE